MIPLPDPETRLIHIASRLAHGEGIPDIDSWEWPKNSPKYMYKRARRDCNIAEDAYKRMAINIKSACDEIREDSKRQTETRSALVEALKTAREYVAADLASNRCYSRGHEDCSAVVDVNGDLAQIDAALLAAGEGL